MADADTPTPTCKPTSRTGTLLPALIGLAGVLIGALTTSGIAYLGDRNRRHDDEQTAVRLVRNEIESDITPLDFLRKSFYPSPLPLTSSAWREEQATLARYLTDKQWNAVSSFYTEVETTEISLKTCRSPNHHGEAAFAFNGAHDALISLGEPRNRVPRRLPERILDRVNVCLP
jgi:hypothetical protein